MSKTTKEQLTYPVAFYSKGVGIICFVSKTALGVWDNGEVSKYPIDHYLGKSDQHGGADYLLFMPASDKKEGHNTDHLLDTIGALHTRNKGLQKGHATLTRRVQELEAELDHVTAQLMKQPSDFSDRAVDAIIADVLKDDVKHLEKLKPEPTVADHQLADDIYSLRRRIACDLHDWSKAAEPVLSRLAAAEHAIKLHNQMRRSGK